MRLISSLWELVEEPGGLLVLIGVAGECIFEWTNWPKNDERRKRLKRTFGLLLILGLAIELPESARLRKLASDANLQVAQLTQTNLELRANVAKLETAVRDLAAVYGQSSNALVEATNILTAANASLSVAQSKIAEANSKLATIRPLKDRVIDFLNDVDPKIIPGVKAGTLTFKVDIPTIKLARLSVLGSEPECGRYIRSAGIDGAMKLGGPLQDWRTVTLVLTPELVK